VICSIAFENARWPRRAGFTLMEMAVVLFIIVLLLGSLMVPLTTQVESRNYAETQRILEQAREALIGFAAANGRLPCPASATSNGAEHFFSPGGAASNGVCNTSVTFAGAVVYVGFLPAATLGFSPVDSSGYAVDAWGLTQNRIRYAVSYQTINGSTFPFTKTNGMRNATMSSISATTTLLYVCNSGTGVTGTACGTATALASSVPTVIWSVGPNAATGGTSTDEAENLDNDRVFVYRPRGDGTAGDFDDIVTWLPSATLFNRLIGAGQLP
jgi:prepilin-type N-terminal cleavage/methylation domain-containing protein